MRVTVYVNTYGVKMCILSGIEVTPGDLSHILPPGAQITDAVVSNCVFSINLSNRRHSREQSYRIALNNRTSGTASTRASALETLRKHIQLYVAEHAPGHVFIHAGAVVLNGQAILLPGRSHAGKSSLVWSLVQSGATYYSDEFAVIDPAGRITAFPVPIALRNPDGSRSGIISAPANVRLRPPVRPDLILLTQYQPCAEWNPTHVPPGIAALHVLRNAVAARRYPERVLRAIGQLVASTPSYAGKRGEAETVVDWIGTYQSRPMSERRIS